MIIRTKNDVLYECLCGLWPVNTIRDAITNAFPSANTATITSVGLSTIGFDVDSVQYKIKANYQIEEA